MNQPGPDGPGVPPRAADSRPATANPLADPAFVAGLRPIPSGPVERSEQWPAADIVGVDLDGRRVEVRIGSYRGPLLLCFLQVRCDGCEEFWRGLAAGTEPGWPDALSAVAVTKGPESVDRTEVARAATGVTAVPVVMSDRAWTDYRVTSYPFFALVDPVLGSVVGETVGFGWPEVLSMVRAHDPEG